jgi:N-acetylmuramyl-L-alanine amidase, negative regulator of ampC, ampD
VSKLDKEGMLISDRITPRRFQGIEKGSRELEQIVGIIIHQTDSSTIQATLNAYNSGGNGAHFLIGKDGHIYQTASVLQTCYHVGKLIKSKCLEIDASSCDIDTAKLKLLTWRQRINAIDKHERSKSYPARYPVNADSIGIEIVGKSIDSETYEAVTAEQNSSLQFLLDELYSVFTKITSEDVYRHPTVSYKNPGEAKSAVWKK